MKFTVPYLYTITSFSYFMYLFQDTIWTLNNFYVLMLYISLYIVFCRTFEAQFNLRHEDLSYPVTISTMYFSNMFTYTNILMFRPF